MVARLATVEEVSQIVTLAAREGIPLVPYGGGTGVMGGVLPVRGGIVSGPETAQPHSGNQPPGYAPPR